MKGDTLEIMKAISDMRSELGERIGEVKASVSGLDGKFEQALEAQKDAAATFRNELLGPGGRIVVIEEKNRSDAKRHWITAVFMPPVTFVLHLLSNKFGVHI